jgi:phytanoyl-CoA hydroxylase
MGFEDEPIEIQSHVDQCDAEIISGWAVISGDLTTKPLVDVFYAGRLLATCVANEFREDLQLARIGDGYQGFTLQLPLIPKGDCGRVEIQVRHPSQPIAQPTDCQRETVSEFGGLWVDRIDWIDRLARKVRNGTISDELSVAVFRFVRDGYVVFEKAVSEDLVDEVNHDVDKLWHTPPEGLLIETWEPDGVWKIIPPEINYRAGHTKLLDIYAFSAAARAAAAAPAVMRFLSAIFEDKPKAFQGLHFWKGSEQAIHKDTAYVRVDTAPMRLAATWLALEDVQLGTGELEYYVGSHRAPDFLFEGKHKWLQKEASENKRFLDSLHDDAARYEHKKSAFLGKKGDVLIWHADLAHGGAPVRNAGTTRKSAVTHFTGKADEPFYRRNSDLKFMETTSCDFVSQYCDVI